MDSIERGLRQDIPLEAAADFFMKLKYGSEGPDVGKIAAMKARMKEKASQMGGLPPTGMGQNMPPIQPQPLSPAGTGAHKVAEAFKTALDDMFGEGMVPPGTMSSPVNMRQYLAMEQEGEAVEQENQAEFLRQKLMEANAQLQSTQDQASTAQQTTEQLQATQSQHEQQLMAAQQQAQLATQAAMQNVEQAHQLAMQATSSALQAKDDAINTHQLAAQMRMAYQDLRGSIMDSVAQDNAAPLGDAIKAKGIESQSVPGAENTSPDMQPQEGGPAGQAAPAAASPSAAPAEGGEGPPNQANGTSEGAGETKPAGQAGTQEQPGVDGSAKQAGVGGDMFRSALGHIKTKAPYAAVGGVLGGGLTAVESQIGHEGLRGQVKEMEGKPGGFGQALRLAAAKARLALGEAVEQHPIAGTIAGAAVGAGAGMALGPGIAHGFEALPGRLRELQGKK